MSGSGWGERNVVGDLNGWTSIDGFSRCSALPSPLPNRVGLYSPCINVIDDDRTVKYKKVVAVLAVYN